MFPLLPTAKKVLVPKVTLERLVVVVVGEVTLSQVDPLSIDLTMFPLLPTATLFTSKLGMTLIGVTTWATNLQGTNLGVQVLFPNWLEPKYCWELLLPAEDSERESFFLGEDFIRFPSV